MGHILVARHRTSVEWRGIRQSGQGWKKTMRTRLTTFLDLCKRGKIGCGSHHCQGNTDRQEVHVCLDDKVFCMEEI